MNKVPLEDKVSLLKEELAMPIVGDMIRNVTQFVMPTPSMTPSPSMVSVEFPQEKIEEKGKLIPVQVLE
jgi:hypothetical protein